MVRCANPEAKSPERRDLRNGLLRVGALAGIVMVLFSLVCSLPRCADARRRSRPKTVPFTLPQSGNLTEDLDRLLTQASLRGTEFGAAVISLSDGRLIYGRQPDRPLIPASNTKLFTTAVALSELGPNYTFNTYVYRRGEIRPDGALSGDVVVRGTGDPTLSRREQIAGWADSLRAKGIRKIDGDIIGDASRANGGGAARARGLIFDQDRLEVVVKPGSKVGERAGVSLGSSLALPMENRTTTIKRVTVTKRTKYRDTRGRTRYRTVHSYKGESLKVQIEDGVVVASGSIAVGTKARHLPVEVRDSGAHFATVVRGVLENEGISIAGKARSSADENALYAGVDPLPLITHHSAPLSELLKIINKRSHNEYAEYLLQTLEKDLECRGLITAGEEPVRQFASENQVGKCELVDGSGLSHQNFVSPLAVVNLLKYVHDQSYFETYMKSLAVAGIDGTLARRMHNSPARGKVYAKTGTVSGVSALSGYAVNHDGKIYAFALLSNNLRSRTLVHQAEDHLCKLLVEMEGS